MEENETPHPDYLKGFNEGYLMAKHLPELSEQLSQDIGKSERISGFKDGRQQLILEQVKDRLPDWLKKDRFSSKDHIPDKTPEKDVDDPDR